MALRDQPYLPLYIKDFNTDEKLAECSAESVGVYIRLMCLMHKSEQYGTILLRQKFKQTDSAGKNFATQLAKHFPYDLIVVERSLIELLEEGVLKIKGDLLYQKRMVKDADVSEKRSAAGRKGANSTHQNEDLFAMANDVANSAIENEYVNGNENVLKGGMGEKIDFNNPEHQKLWESEKNNFLNAGNWIFKFCTDKKITVDKFDSLSIDFISDIELKEDFKTVKELRNHFTNWYNSKNKKNGNHTASSTNGNSRQGTSAARTDALKKW